MHRRIGPPGSFWGLWFGNSLADGVFQFPHPNLTEWRATDIVARYRVTTQSLWKLKCGVSVGGHTILSLVRLQAIVGPLKAGARQTVLRSGLQRYSRHSCGIPSGVTSTGHGAIELRADWGDQGILWGVISKNRTSWLAYSARN